MSAPQIPAGLPAEVHKALRSVLQWADQQFRGKVDRGTANDSILLVSPNRLVYSVQVADDGTLTTTLVSDV